MGGSDNIQVAIRVRPRNKMELSSESGVVVKIPHATEDPAEVATRIVADGDKFDFNYCLDSIEPSSSHFVTQEIVWNQVGEALIRHAMDGFNASLFAYGQTGSGKTFSVVGVLGDPKNEGLLPRMIDKLYAEKSVIEGQAAAGEFDAVHVSFHVEIVEIYMEKVYDLLSASQQRRGKRAGKVVRAIRQGKDGTFYVQNATRLIAATSGQMRKYIFGAFEQREQAATQMNHESSRSHCLVTVYIKSKTTRKVEGEGEGEGEGETGQKQFVEEKTSQVTIADLAGSERAEKTKAEGERLKEGSAINQSLSSLIKVFETLTDPKKRASLMKRGRSEVECLRYIFRNSALTRLLMNSLIGNSKTIMLAAVSPAELNADETKSTLRYAQRVSTIQTQAARNVSAMEKAIEQIRKELTDTVERELRQQLQQEFQGRISQAESAQLESQQREAELRAQLEALLRGKAGAGASSSGAALPPSSPRGVIPWLRRLDVSDISAVRKEAMLLGTSSVSLLPLHTLAHLSSSVPILDEGGEPVGVLHAHLFPLPRQAPPVRTRGAMPPLPSHGAAGPELGRGAPEAEAEEADGSASSGDDMSVSASSFPSSDDESEHGAAVEAGEAAAAAGEAEPRGEGTEAGSSIGDAMDAPTAVEEGTEAKSGAEGGADPSHGGEDAAGGSCATDDATEFEDATEDAAEATDAASTRLAASGPALASEENEEPAGPAASVPDDAVNGGAAEAGSEEEKEGAPVDGNGSVRSVAAAARGVATVPLERDGAQSDDNAASDGGADDGDDDPMGLALEGGALADAADLPGGLRVALRIDGVLHLPAARCRSAYVEYRFPDLGGRHRDADPRAGRWLRTHPAQGAGTTTFVFFVREHRLPPCSSQASLRALVQAHAVHFRVWSCPTEGQPTLHDRGDGVSTLRALAAPSVGGAGPGAQVINLNVYLGRDGADGVRDLLRAARGDSDGTSADGGHARLPGAEGSDAASVLANEALVEQATVTQDASHFNLFSEHVAQTQALLAQLAGAVESIQAGSEAERELRLSLIGRISEQRVAEEEEAARRHARDDPYASEAIQRFHADLRRAPQLWRVHKRGFSRSSNEFVRLEQPLLLPGARAYGRPEIRVDVRRRLGRAPPSQSLLERQYALVLSSQGIRDPPANDIVDAFAIAQPGSQVFLNGREIVPGVRHPLHHGDRLVLGRSYLRYVFMSMAAPVQPVQPGRADTLTGAVADSGQLLNLDAEQIDEEWAAETARRLVDVMASSKGYVDNWAAHANVSAALAKHGSRLTEETAVALSTLLTERHTELRKATSLFRVALGQEQERILQTNDVCRKLQVHLVYDPVCAAAAVPMGCRVSDVAVRELVSVAPSLRAADVAALRTARLPDLMVELEYEAMGRIKRRVHWRSEEWATIKDETAALLTRLSEDGDDEHRLETLRKELSTQQDRLFRLDRAVQKLAASTVSTDRLFHLRPIHGNVPLRVGRLRSKAAGGGLSTRSADRSDGALSPLDGGRASLQVVVEPMLSPASLQEQDVLARQTQLEEAYETMDEMAAADASVTLAVRVLAAERLDALFEQDVMQGDGVQVFLRYSLPCVDEDVLLRGKVNAADKRVQFAHNGVSVHTLRVTPQVAAAFLEGHASFEMNIFSEELKVRKTSAPEQQRALRLDIQEFVRFLRQRMSRLPGDPQCGARRMRAYIDEFVSHHAMVHPDQHRKLRSLLVKESEVLKRVRKDERSQLKLRRRRGVYMHRR